MTTLPASPTAEPAGLQLFLGYRVLLAAILMVVHYTFPGSTLGNAAPALFNITLQTYLLISIGALMFSLSRPKWLESQAILALTTDLFAIVLLMHASGGVTSGLGMLVAINVTLGALLMNQRHALTMAAIASLLVVTETFTNHYYGANKMPGYLHAGLLGLGIFLLSFYSNRIAERARRSERLAQQRGLDLANMAELSEYVIGQLEAGILLVDEKGVVQIANDAAWRLLGRPSSLYYRPLKQISEALAARHSQWRNEGSLSERHLYAHPQGTALRVNMIQIGEAAAPHGLIILEDNSQLAAQAKQMKLASLGRLTAGIAHEIRNPLGAISHAAQLLDEAPELAQGERRMTRIIHDNAKRVNQVVESILKLSRQNPPQREQLDLRPWLNQLRDELTNLLALNGDQLQLLIDPDPLWVNVDRDQLRQVLHVLADNAQRHFSGEPEDLRITLHAGINPQDQRVFIEVCDNGSGIDPQLAEQLFEPFFTTRNDGTGLGLYIAQQLCEANRIQLQVWPAAQPANASGTCFRLHFNVNPATEKTA